MEDVEQFLYLGSAVAGDGGTDCRTDAALSYPKWRYHTINIKSRLFRVNVYLIANGISNFPTCYIVR